MSRPPEPFKICPNCGTVWPALTAFLEDPELEPSGYQVAFQDLAGGLFYFTHTRSGCGTTMAIPVKVFASLSNRPFLTLHGEQPKCCPALCLRQSVLDPCPEECECVWVREILQIVRNWKKKA